MVSSLIFNALFILHEDAWPCVSTRSRPEDSDSSEVDGLPSTAMVWGQHPKSFVLLGWSEIIMENSDKISEIQFLDLRHGDNLPPAFPEHNVEHEANE